MSKPKVILFDCDGVLVRYPCGFAESLEQQGYANAREVMEAYVREANAVTRCEGDEDDVALIKPYLEKLGWKGTAEEFFKEHFRRTEKYLDRNLIAEIQKLRREGVKCCLATNQYKLKADQLMEGLDFRNCFDRHYISYVIGYRKNTDEFWQSALRDIERELGAVNPWDIVFFDDSQVNIDVASKFGIQSYLFTDIVQFERDMNMLGFYISLNNYC